MSGCISLATTNVLLNGTQAGEFELERGLRQGDPLSPFLFLIIAEGLNVLIKRVVLAGLLKPIEVGKDKMQITHFQYANDMIFVVEGNQENTSALKWLLIYFEMLSGLEVNFDKSYAYGFNLDVDQLEEIGGILKCGVGREPIPYLGVNVGGR